MHPFETILVEKSGGVATITINAPPVNAVTRRLSDELTLAFDTMSTDDEVRAVVFTARGRIFCAGADLKNRARNISSPTELIAHSRRTREVYHAIRECAKPVVAALNGPAVGAGLVMAACADILLASEAAFVSLPEVDIGLAGGCRHAMRLFGHSTLRRMALTGYRVSARELYRLGIIEQCTAPEELLPAALDIARQIASKSAMSTSLGKHTLNVLEELGLRDGYRYEQDMTAVLAKTDDAKEAQLAFVEKRPPVFQGR